MAAELISGRRARMTRTTSESDVYVEMDLDGTGRAEISTTVPFYDHMLTALSRHSQIDLTVRATGDTHIDVHHTVEDVAITLGEVLKTALGDKSGIRRFGDRYLRLGRRHRFGGCRDLGWLRQRFRFGNRRRIGCGFRLRPVELDHHVEVLRLDGLDGLLRRFLNGFRS